MTNEQCQIVTNMIETLAQCRDLFDRYHRTEPSKYHCDMKSVSIPLNIMILEEFGAIEFPEKKYGRVVSELIEAIFVENVYDAFDFDDHYPRIRTVLPQRECYKFISMLYNTYLMIGLEDLTIEVNDAIIRWLGDNQPVVKAARKA